MRRERDWEGERLGGKGKEEGAIRGGREEGGTIAEKNRVYAN